MLEVNHYCYKVILWVSNKSLRILSYALPSYAYPKSGQGFAHVSNTCLVGDIGNITRLSSLNQNVIILWWNI